MSLEPVMVGKESNSRLGQVVYCSQSLNSHREPSHILPVREEPHKAKLPSNNNNNNNRGGAILSYLCEFILPFL